jgi:signal transduction histidine kinase
MNRVSNFTFRRTVRSVEWTIIATAFFLTLAIIDPNNYGTRPSQVIFKLFFLGIAAGMSMIFPIDATLFQKRLYVALNLTVALLLYGVGFASAGIDLLLYIVLAKSGLLLSRRDATVTAILSGVACVSIIAVRMPDYLEFARVHISQYIASLNDTSPEVLETIVNNTFLCIAVNTFVVLFACSMADEQKNRQKAERLAQEVESLAASLERNRIAREIHDVLGHSLTTLNVQLELAQRLYLRNPEQGITSLNIAKQLASGCLTDVQQSVHGWRKQDFDLTKAVHQLVEQVQHNSKISVHLDIDLPSIPLQTSHQIYCIFQEGFTNIQKHANTETVYLKGKKTSDTIFLKLTDKGCGFNPQAAHQGFGLRGMEERVQIMGGSLSIDSAPGQGTQIQVVIPCDSTV